MNYIDVTENQKRQFIVQYAYVQNNGYAGWADYSNEEERVQITKFPQHITMIRFGIQVWDPLFGVDRIDINMPTITEFNTEFNSMNSLYQNGEFKIQARLTTKDILPNNYNDIISNTNYFKPDMSGWGRVVSDKNSSIAKSDSTIYFSFNLSETFKGALISTEGFMWVYVIPVAEIVADFKNPVTYEDSRSEPYKITGLELLQKQNTISIYTGQGDTGWQQAIPYIYTGNSEGWKQATPYIYDGSQWKSTS